MNRNHQERQPEIHSTLFDNSLFPSFQLLERGDRPLKSAFRFWKQASEQEDSHKELDADSKKQTTLSLADSTQPIERYVYIEFKQLVSSATQVNRSPPTPTSVSSLASDEPPRVTLKQRQVSHPTPARPQIASSHQHHQSHHTHHSHPSSIPKDFQFPVPHSQRKCCKCKKSQCLLLYCECFRAGQMCEGCSCQNCMNTLEFTKQRAEAIQRALEVNPLAFAEEKKEKGCKCRKSGCRKGYCECFQQGKGCTEACICTGCKNYEGHGEKESGEKQGMGERCMGGGGGMGRKGEQYATR